MEEEEEGGLEGSETLMLLPPLVVLMLMLLQRMMMTSWVMSSPAVPPLRAHAAIYFAGMIDIYVLLLLIFKIFILLFII